MDALPKGLHSMRPPAGKDCLHGEGIAPYTKNVYYIPMNSREVIRKLLDDGWFHVSTEGDHWHFKHPTKSGKTTVPHPKKELGIFVIKSIERQSGVMLRNTK